MPESLPPLRETKISDPFSEKENASLGSMQRSRSGTVVHTSQTVLDTPYKGQQEFYAVHRSNRQVCGSVRRSIA